MHDIAVEPTREHGAEAPLDDAQLAAFRAIANRLWSETSEARFEATLRKLLDHSEGAPADERSPTPVENGDAESIRDKA